MPQAESKRAYRSDPHKVHSVAESGLSEYVQTLHVQVEAVAAKVAALSLRLCSMIRSNSGSVSKSSSPYSSSWDWPRPPPTVAVGADPPNPGSGPSHSSHFVAVGELENVHIGQICSVAAAAVAADSLAGAGGAVLPLAWATVTAAAPGRRASHRSHVETLARFMYVHCVHTQSSAPSSAACAAGGAEDAGSAECSGIGSSSAIAPSASSAACASRGSPQMSQVWTDARFEYVQEGHLDNRREGVMGRGHQR